MAGDLWLPVMVRLAPSASEVWGRDLGRVDDTLAELYLLGERPTVAEARYGLQAAGLRGTWSDVVVERWHKRCKMPTWCPRHLASGAPGRWVLPFYWPDVVARDLDLKTVSDRLQSAVAAAADTHMSTSRDAPGTQQARTAEAVFWRTANALNLWALAGDAAPGAVFPSVMAGRIGPSGPREHLTSAGRALERLRLERYRAEPDATAGQG